MSRDEWLVIVAQGASMALGVTGIWFDVRQRRLPNRLTLAGLIAAVAIVSLSSSPATVGVSAAIGGALLAVPLLVLHLVRPSEVGFGDVKFAVPVGALAGILAVPLTMVVYFGAMVVVLVGMAVRPAWRRSVPFGACLGIGLIITVLAGRWWLQQLGLGSASTNGLLRIATLSEEVSP